MIGSNPAGTAAALRELAGIFLRLGTISFGGPAAHIAMMEEEVVRRRAWLVRGEFLDLVGAVNLIPGPNSTELAIHIGYQRAGWKGLIVAGVSFIVPAALIVSVCAWAYVRWGITPWGTSLFYGIKPVVLAVVAQAVWGLGRSALKSRFLVVVGCAAFILAIRGAGELTVLFGAGSLCVLNAWVPRRAIPVLILPKFSALTPGVAAGPVSHLIGLQSLFLQFAKVGSLLFGSGYVLLAFLQAEFVDRRGWLTSHQLLDAIAVGQLTPGPVFTTATFVGYLLAGARGAVAATAGIFLPAFVFVALTAPFISSVRKSKILGTFLDGVNAASLALMASVTVQISRVVLCDPVTILLAVVAGMLLIRARVNSAYLILGGAAVGAFFSFLRGGS